MTKKLTESEKTTLMKLIQADELLNTLDYIIKRKSKSPGPDGITYYKHSSTFLLQLSQHLINTPIHLINNHMTHRFLQIVECRSSQLVE